ncbi:MAG: SCO family protein [bacterium]|nr:SCO family protein [bacterium]
MGNHTLSQRLRRRVILCSLTGLVVTQLAFAQRAEFIPQALDQVGVTEKLDMPLPLDLSFRNESGDWVELGSYFDGDRPVILTLNYYRCPMLCGLQLNGLVSGLVDLDWTAGDQFEMVTVSINPLETSELAAAKKASYINKYNRPGAGSGWHFLTGKEEDIAALAESVGFGFEYDEKQKEYAHPAVIFVSTPDGRVARYLYGIEYPARRLRLALLEASEGRVGSTWDRILLYCYHYDPSSRGYAPVAMNIMRLGGGVTVAVLGSTLGLLWIREARRRSGKRRKREDT